MKSTIRFIDTKTGKRISARTAGYILFQAIKKRKREEVRRQARSRGESMKTTASEAKASKTGGKRYEKR